MSNNIESTRAPFFPHSKSAQAKRAESLRKAAIQRTTPMRQQELTDFTAGDTQVNIPNAVKEYSRIKKAVDAAPPVDNSAKIAKLKSQINNGTYNVNYDAIADKLLSSEF